MAFVGLVLRPWYLFNPKSLAHGVPPPPKVNLVSICARDLFSTQFKSEGGKGLLLRDFLGWDAGDKHSANAMIHAQNCPRLMYCSRLFICRKPGTS